MLSSSLSVSLYVKCFAKFFLISTLQTRPASVQWTWSADLASSSVSCYQRPWSAKQICNDRWTSPAMTHPAETCYERDYFLKRAHNIWVRLDQSPQNGYCLLCCKLEASYVREIGRLKGKCSSVFATCVFDSSAVLWRRWNQNFTDQHTHLLTDRVTMSPIELG